MTELNRDSTSAEQTILQIELRTMDAIKNKDTATLSSFVADDFIHRTPNGNESNKSDFLKGIAALPLEVLSISGDHLKVNVYGDSAVLTGVQKVTVRNTDGQKESGAAAFMDVFVKRQGEWIMVLAYSVDLPAGSDSAAA
jgi:ketosteroid isomerase-like protein